MTIKIKNTKHRGFWYQLCVGETFQVIHFDEDTYEVASLGKWSGKHIIKNDCDILDNHNIFVIEKIYLGNGEFAIIDSCDKEIIEKHTWYKNKGNYAYTIVDKKTVLMHRLITNCPEHLVVDHRDGHRLDNRRINLRICSQLQNMQSKMARREGSSSYIGVSYSNTEKKWISKITFTNKQGKRMAFTIGQYEDEIRAAIAFNLIAKEFRGEFAKLNDVDIDYNDIGDIIGKRSVKKFREELGLSLNFLNY